MSSRAPRRFAALLAVAALAGSAHAEVKDAAELLPAQTLACVEVRQPERLAREVSALLQGSELDDMPAVMTRFREKLGDNGQFWAFYEALSLSIVLSPEMINECGRIQGAIVGVTGVGKDGPEIVGVVRAGDSNFPTFYMRAMLTMDFSIRSAGEVEGVRIYRERRQNFQAAAVPVAPGQAAPAPQWEDTGPFMALLPSTLVFASTADGVKDVVLRFKGKSAEPSLASVAAYKEASKLRDKPGLFAYTDLAALAQRMDAAGKTLGAMEGQWRLVKAVVNPKAVHAATASLTLQNGVVELKARADLDPKEPSPLADLLAAQPAPPDALFFAPRDGMLTLSLNLSDGEKRWQKLMDLIDVQNKPEPGEADRPAPSAGLHDAESRLKLSVGKDVLGRLAGAALVVEPGEAGRPDGRPVRLLVLQAADADGAKYLEEQGLAKLLGLASLLGGGPAEPPAVVRQDVDGRPVSAVSAAALAGALNAKDLYVGREGAFVVVGDDAKEVAAALNAGAKKEGLLGEEKTAAAVKGVDGATAVAAFSLGKGAVELARAMERSGPVFTAVTPAPAPPGPNAKPPADQPPKLSKSAEARIAQMAKTVGPLPPAVVGLGRTPEGLTLEIRQTGLKGVSQKVIDRWIDSILERILEQQKPAGG